MTLTIEQAIARSREIEARATEGIHQMAEQCRRANALIEPLRAAHALLSTGLGGKLGRAVAAERLKAVFLAYLGEEP